MKKIFSISCALLYTISSLAQGFGNQQLFNSDWRFNLGDIKYGGKEYMDISYWQPVELPHDWSVLQNPSPAKAACTGFLPGGIAWYRKEFNVPTEKKEDKVFIYFEGVYNNSEVFINGKWVGKRPNGYISFMYDLTPFIKFGEKNSIAVRVDHSEDADSRWYTGSGIYRNVKLVYAPQTHIDLWGVFWQAKVKDSNAILSVQATINNEQSVSKSLKVVNRLKDASGKSVSEDVHRIRIEGEAKQKVCVEMNVAKPELWSIDSPYLYTLETKIYDGEQEIDATSSSVGIRTITFDPNKGFFLNGKNIKMKGVCIHHDGGCLGAAVPIEVWREKLRQLKSIGCNAIRMSHNPQSQELFDACDELGFLVMAEAFDEWEYPKKKWIEGWNKGNPGFQGSAPYFREWGKRDLTDMIMRDRNHPSIVMWSIGNEVDYPNDPYSHPILDQEGIGQIHTKGYQESQPRAERLGDIAKELVAAAKKCDTSRPITAALAGAVMSNETDYPGVLDVVGYNYTESRYEQDHKKYPSRVLYGSENGRGVREWKNVVNNDYIFGQFVWTGMDYLGESGPWPSRGFTTGFIDLAGNIKPHGYLRRALWSEHPVAYIGTYRESPRNLFREDAPAVWNYAIGDRIRVVAYTNAEEAELYLNGKLVGERTKYNPETCVIGWDVPFEDGVLELKGYNKGVEAVTTRLETTGVPFALKAELIDGKSLKEQEYAIVKVTVIDEKERVVPIADNMVNCRLSGAAEIKGMENGSNNVTDNFHSNHLRVINGSLIIYVKRGINSSGEVILNLSSPFLKSTMLQLR